MRKTCKLSFQVVIYRFVNRQDRIKQRPVSRSAVQCPHRCRQGFDEALVLQLGYVLPHRVGAHASVFSNFPKARVANVCLPVLAKNQVCVHGDLTRTQSQGEDLVRQKEKSSLPWFSLASPSHFFNHPPSRFSNFPARSLFFVLCGSTFAWGVPLPSG